VSYCSYGLFNPSNIGLHVKYGGCYCGTALQCQRLVFLWAQPQIMNQIGPALFVGYAALRLIPSKSAQAQPNCEVQAKTLAATSGKRRKTTGCDQKKGCWLEVSK
jgi:hypothetical protein